MVSFVVTNNRCFEHGDQAADWMEPLGISHRSGVHLFVCHTRKTLPTVDVNSSWPFGDHLANAHGIPIRFKFTLRFESTSHKIAFESLKDTDTSNEPFRFHSNELIGWWFVLNEKLNTLVFNILASLCELNIRYSKFTVFNTAMKDPKNVEFKNEISWIKQNTPHRSLHSLGVEHCSLILN